MINRRFGAYELLTVAVVCLVISVIVLMMAFSSSDNEKYGVMKSNAQMLGLSVNDFTMEDIGKDKVTLLELIDSGMVTAIKNPFIGAEYCDFYDSYVKIVGEQKYVTLECGKYLIYNQSLSDNNYKLYETSEWSNNKSKSPVIKKTGYNYFINNKSMLDDYYEEDTFLYLFNRNNKTKYTNIKDIPSNYIINKEVFYKSIKLVKDITDKV